LGLRLIGQKIRSCWATKFLSLTSIEKILRLYNSLLLLHKPWWLSVYCHILVWWNVIINVRLSLFLISNTICFILISNEFAPNDFKYRYDLKLMYW